MSEQPAAAARRRRLAAAYGEGALQPPAARAPLPAPLGVAQAMARRIPQLQASLPAAPRAEVGRAHENEGEW